MDRYDFLADPRAITLQQRRAQQQLQASDQQFWLQRLRALAEGERPADDFPAFLLATPAFTELAARLQPHHLRAALPAATADELDWFLAAYRDYLRTVDGEDAFSPEHAASPRR